MRRYLAIVANIVFRSIQGQHAVITMPQYDAPVLKSLWLFLLLGMFFGVFGVIFNRLVTLAQDVFDRIHRNERRRYILTGTLLGGCFGLLLLYLPELTGGGITLIPSATHGEYSISLLLILFLARVATTLLCFGSGGAPGGIFAPMLALGTLFGTFFGSIAQLIFPDLGIERECLRLPEWGRCLPRR